MVPVQVRKLLISGLQQEYGARLLETLVTSAVLTLPSYTYTDIGRGSLPHFASYIGKLPFSEPLDFFGSKQFKYSFLIGDLRKVHLT
jgi:hypothetical protein